MPSAAERAKKWGGKPSDYTRLFITHSKCELAKRRFRVGQTVISKRDWTRFKIHAIDFSKKMLIDVDNRAISFKEAN